VSVFDNREIVVGKTVALMTRRAARDLFDVHRMIAMPDLNWTIIKAATLMNGVSAKSFDWRAARQTQSGARSATSRLSLVCARVIGI
jgi:hypothetical protein